MSTTIPLQPELGTNSDVIVDRLDALGSKRDSLRRERRRQFYVLFALLLIVFATMLSSFFV